MARVIDGIGAVHAALFLLRVYSGWRELWQDPEVMVSEIFSDLSCFFFSPFSLHGLHVSVCGVCIYLHMSLCGVYVSIYLHVPLCDAYVSVCVWCVCVSVCMRLGPCRCMGLWRLEIHIRSLPLGLVNPKAWWDGQPHQTACSRESCLCRSRLGCRVSHRHLMSVLESRFGPLADAAST